MTLPPQPKNQPKNQIALVRSEHLGEDSREVARIWVTNGAGSSVWIDAGVLADPGVFGFLVADTIRHAARAYAAAWGMSEQAALEAIVRGVDADLCDPDGEVTTVANGRPN